MNIAVLIGLGLKISLFLTALGFGLKAAPDDVFYLLRRPKQLLKSVVSMNLVMPLVAIFMGLLLDLPFLVKVTLLAISVSPLAPLFPKKTMAAGGRDAYVLGLMLVVSGLSVVLIPLTLNVIARVFRDPVEVDVVAIVTTVLVTVMVPLALGIAMRRLLPVFAGKIAAPVARIAQILLLISAVPVLLKMFPTIIHLVGNGTLAAFVAFVVIGVIVGHLLGGPDAKDRTVLALATASRHPAIAMSIASANLTDHHLVPAAILLYLLINAITIIPYQIWLRKKQNREEA